MSRTAIPASLRDLFANWSKLDVTAQNFAYASVTVTPGEKSAAFEEARAASAGLTEYSKGWYAARAFHIWLGRFTDTQNYYRQTGLMDKLRDFYAKQAAAERIAA